MFEKRVHHCGDQKFTAVMLLAKLRHRHVGFAGLEFDGPPQRTLTPFRQPQSHLFGEAEQDRFFQRFTLKAGFRYQIVAGAMKVKQLADEIGKREH